ncbi:type VI secretion protein [Erwinia typographi]|uniref:Type VI secretion protein n=1 Tax=Erwinia typographi TaxID=371042 RepID=A0A0A3Z9Q9_9GAMM|nr:type VI secretion system protein TssA [Erwinia typographi]KGT95615.1 type VI secretion protein [Erwinia typographi]
MPSLNSLLNACQAEQETLLQQTHQRIALWNNWLLPVPGASAVGEDPGYDDDFQQMREEVNKLSGADSELVCRLAEKLLTNTAKDIRVASYYCWAKLHREGESGLADGLALLAGLLERYGAQLHPQRARSRKAALEWLAGSRMVDSLSLYPEVVRKDALHTVGALLVIMQWVDGEPDETRPQLNGLFSALEYRLMKSGGVDAVVPQNASDTPSFSSAINGHAPELSRVTSGQELLAQGRTLTAYLQEQPGGWLPAHHLMKSLRHDTLQELPAMAGDGRTRIEPPKADQRALLKRLYLQQSWGEILEQADSLFSRGANHLWLDLQWYIHQGLLKSGQNTLADIIAADLKGLLTRLQGLETLAFNDGTPFADEVTLNWIQQGVMETAGSWGCEITTVADSCGDNDILQLEPEAVALADSEGTDAALNWLQNRPGIASERQKWLLRLLMARVAEQYGKNELAMHLLGELDTQAGGVTLDKWEPGLLFEVRARRLKLLRMKAGRSEADKARLSPLMEQLLAGLISLDPVRAAVLCG